MKKLLLAITLLFIFSCSDDDPVMEPTPEREDNPILMEMLSIAEANSINLNTLDWTMVKDEVNSTYQSSGFNAAVRKLLTLLNDNHSFYQPISGPSLFGIGRLSCGDNYNLSGPSDTSTGYIKVDGFSGSREEGVQLATSIQQRIMQQYQHNGVMHWIVNLSDNGGGNMWPMICGLGPLLGEGTHGHFINPDGSDIPWGYQNGASWIGESKTNLVEVSNPFSLAATPSKIAVVIDAPTASSGEATAIAFKGLDNVKFFGQPSCGLSTANQTFTLTDGSRFFLTVSVMADRDKTPFGRAVPVDVEAITDQAIHAEIEQWFAE